MAYKAFIDVIGVNTHLDFTWTAYKDRQKVITALNYLGIKHVRDSANSKANLDAGFWREVAVATGVKFNAYIGSGSVQNMQDGLVFIQELAKLGFLEIIEGPNEEDMQYAMNLGNDIFKAAEFQKAVYKVGKQLGLPVINMSFGQGWAEDPQHGHYDDVGDLSAYCDFANAHTYPVKGQDPAYAVRFVNGLALLAAKSRPIITTELGFSQTGYAGRTEQEAADGLKIAILEAVKTSDKIYIYELLDQKTGDASDQNNFGLFRSDGTPKPAAAMLRDLLRQTSSAATPPAESVVKPPVIEMLPRLSTKQLRITDPFAAGNAGTMALNLRLDGTLPELNAVLANIPGELVKSVEAVNQKGKTTILTVKK